MSMFRDDITAKPKEQDKNDLKGSFGCRLSSLLQDKKLSQADLVRITGEARSKISAYANGQAIPSADTAIAIADALEVSVPYLILGRGADGPAPEFLVPVLNVRLAAGNSAWSPQQLEDGHMVLDEGHLRQLGKTNATGLFVARIEGDSLYPMLSNNDPVLFDSTDTRIRDGVFAFRLGDDLRIKTLRKFGLNAIELISVNPLYPPERIEGADLEHFEVLGRALYAWKSL